MDAGYIFAALSSLSFSGIDAVISFQLFDKVTAGSASMETSDTCDERLGHKVPFWDENADFGTKSGDF